MANFREANPKTGWTKIHHMATTGDLYKLRTMLTPDDLKLIDKKGRSVLHEVAKGGFLFQIAPLIQKEMLCIQDKSGVTRELKNLTTNSQKFLNIQNLR